MKSQKNCVCTECSALCLTSLKNLSGDDLKNLSLLKTMHHYRKGEIIFHQDTPSFGLHCIQSGSIKLFTQEEDGKEIIKRLAHAGDFIGHSSAFGSKSYVESAKVLEDTICCFIETQHFKSFLDTSPQFLSEFLKTISLELAEASNRHADMIRKSVKARLASYLVKMAEDSVPEDERYQFTHHLSREEMASYIGSAHETVIRCLSEFKELGYIEEENRSFTILNKERLIHLGGLIH